MRTPSVVKIFAAPSLNGKEAEMAKNILHLGKEGYGSDHLIKAMKDYICKWCEKDIHKGNLYARHSPNKFQEPLKPVCRDCAWWLKEKNQP